MNNTVKQGQFEGAFAVEAVIASNDLSGPFR